MSSSVIFVRPIETVYRGYHFRSRLEARWAVFFDTLSIPFMYEPEGFELPGVRCLGSNGRDVLESTRYLPDFWLPEQDCWVEIKGVYPSKEDRDKAQLLAIHSGKDVFVFFGDVYQLESRNYWDEDGRQIESTLRHWDENGTPIESALRFTRCFYPASESPRGVDTLLYSMEDGYQWTECCWNGCGKLAITCGGFGDELSCHASVFKPIKDTLREAGLRGSHSLFKGGDSPRLIEAYTRARQMRF